MAGQSFQNGQTLGQFFEPLYSHNQANLLTLTYESIVLFQPGLAQKPQLWLGLKRLWLCEIVGRAKAIFHSLALAWPSPGRGFCTYDNNNKCIQRINESRYATQTNRLCPHHPHQSVYHPMKAPQRSTQVSLNPHLKRPPTLHQALQIPILMMVQVLDT